MNMDDLRKQSTAKDDALARENRTLRTQLDRALAALEFARAAEPPPRSEPNHAALRTDHARVFCGDLHAYYQDLGAVDALLADIESLQPADICLLGDMIDCGAFLAQHQTLGFVAEGEYTFEQDLAACSDFLNRLQAVAPKARIVYLEGNHEHRIEKWCITQTLRNAKDAAMLYRFFNPRSILKLDDRGIRYVTQSEFVDGVSIRGTMVYGTDGCEVYATHGITACKHAAAKHVERFGGNVVYGHTHRADSYVINTVTKEVIGAWSPGSLCQRVRLWNHNQPDNWTTGYHVQLVSRSGLFQPLNVKLVRGVSLLAPLLGNGADESEGDGE